MIFAFSFLFFTAFSADKVGECCNSGLIDSCNDCPYGYEPDDDRDCGLLRFLKTADYNWVCRDLLDDVDQDALEDLLISVKLANLATEQGAYVSESGGDEDVEEAVNYFNEDVEYLAGLGYYVETPIWSENYIEAPDRDSYVVTWYYANHHGEKQLVVGYHGSAELEDWTETNIPGIFSDEETCLTISGSEYCLSSHVYEDYELTRDIIKSALFEILDEDCNKDCISVIRIVSHSMRGPAAGILALELIEKYGNEYQLWVSTFGSIRALTEESADRAHSFFTDNSDGHRFYRYMMNGDIIPQYFPSPWKHFGQAMFIDDGHLQAKGQDYVPDDHDVEECGLIPVDCVLNNHRIFSYEVPAELAREYYYTGDSIAYQGPTKSCPCAQSFTFQLKGASGSEVVNIIDGAQTQTVTLSTSWVTYTASNFITVEFTNDSSENDVYFQSDYEHTIRSDARWPGWYCDIKLGTEDSRCDSVRGGAFAWETSYQIEFTGGSVSIMSTLMLAIGNYTVYGDALLYSLAFVGVVTVGKILFDVKALFTKQGLFTPVNMEEV